MSSGRELACISRKAFASGASSRFNRNPRKPDRLFFASPECWFEKLEPRLLMSAPANLDPSFGQNGMASLPEGHFATAITAAPAGAFYVAGGVNGSNEIELFRFNSNGILDASFGTDGIGSSDVGMWARPGAIIVQPDGKILVTCMWNATTYNLDYSGLISRFNSDGSVDTRFGSNGTASITGHNNFYTAGVAVGNYVDTMLEAASVSSDGKITAVSKDGTDIQLARLNADGSPDLSFGPDGKKFIPLQSTANIPGQDIVAGITPDGGFVVDEIYYPLNTPDFYFVPLTQFRINSAGDLVSKSDVALPAGFGHAEAARSGPDGQFRFYKIGDASFTADLNAPGGSTLMLGGVVPTWSGFPGQDPSLSIAPDGKVYAVGVQEDGGSALQRFNADGTPDASFSHGQVMSGIGDAGLYTSLPLADGSVIVEGYQSSGVVGFFKVLPGGPAGPTDPIPVDPADAYANEGLSALLVPPGQINNQPTGNSYNRLFGNAPIGLFGLNGTKRIFDSVDANA